MKRVKLGPNFMRPATPYTPPPNLDTRPDANFTGTLDEWNDRVFNHAVEFRLHRFTAALGQSDMTVATFAEAMVRAVDAMKEGDRVIVYAVTESGRHVALEKERWGHYAKLWLDRTGGHHE
jgi:hypothetical protein